MPIEPQQKPGCFPESDSSQFSCVGDLNDLGDGNVYGLFEAESESEADADLANFKQAVVAASTAVKFRRALSEIVNRFGLVSTRCDYSIIRWFDPRWEDRDYEFFDSIMRGWSRGVYQAYWSDTDKTTQGDPNFRINRCFNASVDTLKGCFASAGVNLTDDAKDALQGFVEATIQSQNFYDACLAELFTEEDINCLKLYTPESDQADSDCLDCSNL